MSEDATTQPVAVVDKAQVKASSKAVQAGAIVRRLGLERSMRAVATARKYEAGTETTFTRDEVALLLQLEKVHLSADDLAAVVKVRVAEVLG